MNVSKVEDGTFHLRIYCQKNPGVLVTFKLALQSVELDFYNANITSSDGHIIKMAIVKVY